MVNNETLSPLGQLDDLVSRLYSIHYGTVYNVWRPKVELLCGLELANCVMPRLNGNAYEGLCNVWSQIEPIKWQGRVEMIKEQACEISNYSRWKHCRVIFLTITGNITSSAAARYTYTNYIHLHKPSCLVSMCTSLNRRFGFKAEYLSHL